MNAKLLLLVALSYAFLGLLGFGLVQLVALFRDQLFPILATIPPEQLLAVGVLFLLIWFTNLR